MENVTESLVENLTQEQAPESAAPVQDDDLSSRLNILARKEKGILSRQQELQQKMKEIEEKNSKLSKWEKLEGLLRENPKAFLQETGVSFSELQEKLLSSMEDDELDPVQKQLKELQNKLAEKDKEFEKLLEDKLSEREKTAKEKEIEEKSKYYQENLNNFIKENAENYDLINTFGVSQEVFNMIKEVYLKTSEKGQPRLMKFDEACDLYEKELEKTVSQMRQSKKVMKLLGGMDDSEDSISELLGTKTIDDSFSMSTAQGEPKTEEERLRAAARILEQQFKSI